MIGVLVSGEGTNLQALLDAGLPVVGVCSNRPRVPALGRAEAAGVETEVFTLEDYPTREQRDAAMAEWLVERGVELVALAGFMHVLRAPFLERFDGRIINTHPALLPSFPGAHPIEDALTYGVRWTGATVHFVDEGVDTGPIILQEPVSVEEGDTVDSLRRRIQAVEHRLLPRAARLVLEGKVWA